ncbi:MULTISPECIES: SDR family NAD(P)-dependent oxidoreductase [Roseobacteraceae]|uniref:SDR family NAD(P)-dependent oxidoreductase n=1 Tax=Roseobacteraceae TaxID=2854170 RepID=UPI00125F467C|nr:MULTISPECIES: SDR family NAD(P)-dependent oxidoreductase [Roseobacteraceae]KAB6715758.1 short-chain dehydrogenase [Roseobacter sp. TSBP12]|tara:strand:- start:2011 stop:2739 length:729 start_codon:yes stop_codon:yes gene_type:complete
MIYLGKTYWIIGGSEGLGRALAEALDAKGARLILSARSEDRLKEVAASLNAARAVVMDVTDAASVEQAYTAAGAVDGVIYVAGTYDPMTAQRWQAKSVSTMFAVNLMGAVSVLNHIVPEFTKRDAGHIVLIGSLSGHRGLPGAIGYGASKAGLMHLAETLYADLHKSGVRVQCANPGFIRTRLTDKNDFDMPMLMEPKEAAAHVMRAMDSGRFETNFPRPFSWLFSLAHFIPRRIFLKITGA